MDRYYDEEEPRDEDQIIEEFLGENPRARDLRLMREALEQRYQTLRRERERTPEGKGRLALNAKISELEKQIDALRQEEAITSFVEDSVRVTLHKPSLEDLEM